MKDVEILVVEDNATDAELTLRALKKTGLTNLVYHVKDGVEALDFLFATGAYASRNVENTPKVIVLDLKMPKVNGFDVLKIIKGDNRTLMIPVVIYTSSKEPEDINKCNKLGVNSYVVKPVESDKFTHVVGELGKYWMNVNQTLK
jgi:two-component system response regulator